MPLFSASWGSAHWTHIPVVKSGRANIWNMQTNPKFRHLVITRTGRVLVLQVITRVGRATFQAGQSETAVGTGGTGHPQKQHRLQGQRQPLVLHDSAICVWVLRFEIYIHTHTCSTTHHGHMYRCTWWYPTFSVHRVHLCKKIPTPADNLSTEMEFTAIQILTFEPFSALLQFGKTLILTYWHRCTLLSENN